MKITIEARGVESAALREDFSEHENITISESKGSTFSLSGEEITAFLFVTLGGGVLTSATYDLLKAYFLQAFEKLKRRISTPTGKIKITVNGIVFLVENEADVNQVVGAILTALSEKVESEDLPRNKSGD